MWTPTRCALVLLVLLLANGGQTILAAMPATTTADQFAAAFQNPATDVELGVLEGNINQTCTHQNTTLNTTLTPLHTLPSACGVRLDMQPRGLPGVSRR